jgi:hypothetical protein
MANQYNSKVVLSDGTVLIDLTQDDIKAEHVQKGIKFHDKSGAQQTGTNTKTVDASNVTAEAAEVLDGETFGKGAEVAVGTMPNNSGKGVTVTNKAGTAIPRGYYDGSSKAAISSEDANKLVPSNIKEGVTILGVIGEFGADDISSQSKEVTPTFEDQQISPDSGYTFLSGVLVKAIPVTRADNSAGGVTVTIG